MKQLLPLAVVASFLFCTARGDAQTNPSAIAPSDWAKQIQSQIASAEGKVTQKAAYEPAAKALALLCQSDQFFFLDEPPFRPAWTPPELLKLEPTWVQIAPDEAHIEFGGGFHHFGYELTLNKSAGNDLQNNWTLNFYSEDSPTKPLMTFLVNKADHIERGQFIDIALAEFQRRALESSVSDKTINERIVFLLKFDQVEMARASIHKCAAANPNDWPDQLLRYIIDAKTNPAAIEVLDEWAKKMGDFSAWLLAAYAHGIAGDEDSMEHCTKSALSHPADDPDWSEYNARFRGTTVCVQLLKARRYETCAVLCDALLAYTDSGEFMVPQLNSIRALAQRATGADSPPALEEGTVFEPFKGIDLSRLIIAKSTTSPSSPSNNSPSAQPSADAQDLLLEYYDHRITADPGSRRNYVIKITYLLSKHRNSEALAACRTAAQVFPDWWRPQMAFVTLTDGGARKDAEPRFRKWVSDHPSFIHWWYLSRYYRDIGRDGDAVAALRSAVKYPLENVDDDEMWVPAAFAFDAASYANRQKEFSLVLDIARVWSMPRGVYNYFDDDIYAFRAAAELALGQFAAAKNDADKVVKAASEHAIWASHLSELQQAAIAQNRSYVYEPGNACGADWSLFSEP